MDHYHYGKYRVIIYRKESERRQQRIMKNKILYAFMVLGIVAILGIGLVTAFRGATSDLTDEEVAEKQVFRTDVQNSIESQDYDAWRSLMESQLTQENFQNIVDRHMAMQERMDIKQQYFEAIQNDDTETAGQLKEQLVELGGFGHYGFRHNGFKNGWSHQARQLSS